MLVGHQPIVAVGAGTYLDELMRIARADNIAAAVGEQWPHLSIEFIIAMRPRGHSRRRDGFRRLVVE